MPTPSLRPQAEIYAAIQEQQRLIQVIEADMVQNRGQ